MRRLSECFGSSEGRKTSPFPGHNFECPHLILYCDFLREAHRKAPFLDAGNILVDKSFCLVNDGRRKRRSRVEPVSFIPPSPTAHTSPDIMSSARLLKKNTQESAFT
jgi:hypothetical protein